MAYLVINDKEFHAKTNFKFERLANEKYSEEAKGDKVGGFMSIYFGMLQFDNSSLLAFWDCALQHYTKDKPTLEQLEEVLEEKIEEDADQAFKDAFKVLDNAGFFRKQVKSIWKEFNKAPKKKKDETKEEMKEREEQEQMVKMMTERYKELTA